MKYNTIEELRKDWPEIPIGKAEDLSGKHINNLTVLYRCLPNDKYKTPRWACKCDCGLYFTVTGNNIRRAILVLVDAEEAVNMKMKLLNGQTLINRIMREKFLFLTWVDYVLTSRFILILVSSYQKCKGNSILLLQVNLVERKLSKNYRQTIS